MEALLRRSEASAALRMPTLEKHALYTQVKEGWEHPWEELQLQSSETHTSNSTRNPTDDSAIFA